MSPIDDRKQLHIKLSDHEFTELQTITARLGISITDYVRYALQTRIKRDHAQIATFKATKRNEVRAMGAYIQALVEAAEAERVFAEAQKAYTPPDDEGVDMAAATTPQQRALRDAPQQFSNMVREMGKPGWGKR